MRTDKADPATNEEAAAVWRLTVYDDDETRLGRTLSDSMNELALATIPGMFSPGSAARPRAFGVYRPAVVPAELVPQYVTFLDGERTVLDPVSIPAAPASPVPSPAPSRQTAATGDPRCHRRWAGSWVRAPATRAAMPTWGCSPAQLMPSSGSTAS